MRANCVRCGAGSQPAAGPRPACPWVANSGGMTSGVGRPERPPQAESLPHSKPNQRGFTLLEVLVATVIMAVAISGLLTALTTSMHNAARLTDHDRAITLARQQMNELLVLKPVPKNVPLQGAWDPVLTGGHPCGWTGIITLFEAPGSAAEGDPSLDRVHLEVWCGDGAAKRTFTMEGFRRGLVTAAEAKDRRP
jgi:general secretion pathway protein I